MNNMLKAHQRQCLKPAFNEYQYILESMLSLLPDAVAWKDFNGTFRGCNNAFAKQFGFNEANEIIGKSNHQLNLPTKLTEKLQHDERTVFTTGIAKLNYEEVHKQEDGSEKILLRSIVPLIDSKGNIIGLVIHATDISHIKELEKEKEENRANKEKIQALKAYAGGLAHELRTPIASIKAGLNGMRKYFSKLIAAHKEHMERNPNSPQEISNKHILHLQEIPNQLVKLADNCNHIVDVQLKNISTDSIITKQFETIQMAGVIHDALESYPFSHDQANLIQCNFDKCADFAFYGDHLLTKHMLWNLLKNALYYIKDAGKGGIELWLESTRHQNHLHFKDTSKGIPPQMTTQIFDKFFTNRSNGTGLGLSFCKMIMESFGGNIYCQSIEGEYTEFVLSFPKIPYYPSGG